MRMHTKEEVEWAKRIIKEKFNGIAPTTTQIRKEGIIDEYAIAFHKGLTAGGLNNWMKRVMGQGHPSERRRKGSKVTDVLQKSNYLLYTTAGGLFGFETKQEIEEFIKNNSMVGGFRVFLNIPVAVSYSVKIG